MESEKCDYLVSEFDLVR